MRHVKTKLKLSTLVIIASLSMTMPSYSLADTVAIQQNIQAGSLVQAINQLSKNNNTVIAFNPNILQGMQTEGLNGQYTFEQGLTQLLANQPVAWEYSNGSYSLHLKPVENPEKSPKINTVSEPYKIDDVNVVVSATGFTQNIADAPASISVIRKKDLEKKSYENFNQVVQNIPGVSLDFVIAWGGNLNIRIRGMEKEYTKILIDGKPATGTLTHYNNEIPPLSAIERVEVIRGPMSSLYSSDALGGTVNIITKKVPKEWTGSLDSQYLFSRDKKIANQIETSTYIAGPIIKDVLGLQLTGLLSKRDEDTNQSGDYEQNKKILGQN